MANASWSSCENTLQLLQQEPPRNAVAAEYPYLGETLTMVAWLTMVNHGWTMVDNG